MDKSQSQKYIISDTNLETLQGILQSHKLPKLLRF